jgi:hypothetical protein
MSQTELIPSLLLHIAPFIIGTVWSVSGPFPSGFNPRATHQSLIEHRSRRDGLSPPRLVDALILHETDRYAIGIPQLPRRSALLLQIDEG